MSNPFNIMNPAYARINQARDMVNMFKNSNNPMALFQQMAAKNPQMQPIANMLNQGANPNQIFDNVCRQRGINPQDIMNLIKG